MQINSATDKSTFMEKEVSESTQKNENVKKEESKSIYAGELNLIGQDEIGAVKAKAQKDAMKTLLSQFSSDKEFQNELDEVRGHRDKMKDAMAEANDEAGRLIEKKNALKESWGIEDDSEEQKDLELMEKQARISSGSREKLSKEEQQRLKDMGPMTEYQQGAMEYNKMAQHFTKIAQDSLEEIIRDNYSITGMQLEDLKYHGMVDAAKEADQIRETASKEVIGTLIQDTKDQIDEKAEEEKEKAEKIAEEEKAKQERAEAKSNEEKDMEKVNQHMSELQELNSNMDKAVQEIKKYVEKESVLSEDVLGLAVDALL